MKRFLLLFSTLILLFFSCSSDDNTTENPTNNTAYFPPIASNLWETNTPEALNWNTNALSDLYTYLEDKDTKGFLILKDGKIIVEQYFNGHTQNSNWYWASAGKTLTALTVGIAQEEGFFNINDKTSDYLGTGWTNCTTAQESLITIKNQLSMTTGMDDTYFTCFLPNCLNYIANADTRWAYQNGPYTLLQSVVFNATNTTFNSYFNTKIKNKIGMNGNWIPSGDLNIYWSTTRSMARFGLLILNNAIWDNTPILNDSSYFNEMTTSSQTINNSYGYLWWLNGKSSYMVPLSQTVSSGSLIPNAPDDMISALGANDQKIYVIPSKNIVIIRMGQTAGGTAFASSGFDNILWSKINAVID